MGLFSSKFLISDPSVSVLLVRAYRSTLIAERRTMLFRHVAEGF